MFVNYKSLLVCKRWRVRTPHLYNNIIIYSENQVESLKRTLTDNPKFGNLVKNLRIDGAYDGGAPAHADNPFCVSPLLFSPLTSGFRGRKAPNG